MNISAKCTATDSLLGMPPQLHVHTNICSANHISEFSVCRCVDMAKMTYLSSNRMRAFPHHPCLQRLLWKRSNILWAAVFWTKMTCWHQSSEENAQTAAEEHLWMDRMLKLEADGLQQHWVPLLYEKLRVQSSQDQRNQTAEDCKTVVWFRWVSISAMMFKWQVGKQHKGMDPSCLASGCWWYREYTIPAYCCWPCLSL